MNIVCSRCGNEKTSNKFYYHKGDNKFMQPCKSCYGEYLKEKDSPEKRESRREKSRIWNKDKGIMSQGVSIKELTNYLITLNELENREQGLVFNRGSGITSNYVPVRIKRPWEAVEESKPVIGIGYRFRWHEQEKQWEVGYFSALGNWITVNSHKHNMDSAQREAIRRNNDIKR